MKYTLESSREFYNNYPGKRASAAMIVRWQDKYLMIKHDYKDVMTFPSGLMDPDESPLTTAIRETAEEVGLELDEALVHFYTVTYIAEQFGFKDRIHFFFITDVSDEQANNLVFEKGVESHVWAEPDTIAEHGGNRDAYTKIQTMLVSGKWEAYFEVTPRAES
jgi:8-oxo-dGTP pyrophosphatase MutT (NUDIX family)